MIVITNCPSFILHIYKHVIYICVIIQDSYIYIYRQGRGENKKIKNIQCRARRLGVYDDIHVATAIENYYR